MRPRAKITVEECLSLDVRSLARAGYLEPGTKSGMLRFRRGDREIGSLGVAMRKGGLQLEYDVLSSEGVRTRLRSVVAVVHTPAINQGERVWFSCPRCHKLAGKLYLPPGKSTFLCRTCHNLTYASRQKRANIWQTVRAELPKLEEDLRNPRLGLERRLKAAKRIEELRAQTEGAFTQTMGLLPPALGLALMGAWTQGAEEVPRQASAAPAKLPRGRPKEKRPYQRRKPFHLGQRRTATEAFCVKCRDYREPTDWALVTFRNGRPALQGLCPSCGSKVARIITASEAAALVAADARLT